MRPSAATSGRAFASAGLSFRPASRARRPSKIFELPSLPYPSSGLSVSGSEATPITTESAVSPLPVLLPGAEQAATPVSIAAAAAAVRIRRTVMNLTPLLMI